MALREIHAGNGNVAVALLRKLHRVRISSYW